MSAENLNVKTKVSIDNSVTDVQYHTYQPYAGTTFNNNDEIKIPIQVQNAYTLPARSYLYIEGKLLKEDGSANASLTFIDK